MPKPGYGTRSMTFRVPKVIREEIYKRASEDFNQTEVLLEALCYAFAIPHPRPKRPLEANYGRHSQEAGKNT
jgi:hypothetical protein